MKELLKQTTAITLVAGMASATFVATASAQGRLSDAERSTLQQRALSELRSLGYQPSQFESIRVRVQRDEIDVEAEGDDIDVDLTYNRAGNALGNLIEGDVEIDDGNRDIERVFVDGGWTETVDDSDEDEDYGDDEDFDDDQDDYDDGDDDSDDDGDDDSDDDSDDDGGDDDGDDD
ncbi:MAG: hypothetical protein AAGA38_16980 [Pseudomonadota bacterium]